MSRSTIGHVDIDDLLDGTPVRLLRALRWFDWADWDDLTISAGVPESDRERDTYYASIRRLIQSGRVERKTHRGVSRFRITDKGRAQLASVSRRVAASVVKVLP